MCSISIAFGVNSQAYGDNSKAMELTPQAWEIEHKRKKTLND